MDDNKWISRNLMNHAEFSINTTYEIDFVKPFAESNTTWYEGYNRFGKLIYKGRVVKKVWNSKEKGLIN